MPKSWKRWTQTELDILENLVDNYPGPELIARYQDTAKKRGLPHRTEKSIRKKVNTTFGSIRPRSKNFTAREFCRILGFPIRRAYPWLRRGWLKTERHKHFCKITPANMRAFARKYPHLLAEADWDGLVYLYGEEIAEWVKSHTPPKKRNCPVMHLRTGQTFPSIRAASKALYYSPSNVSYHLARGQRWARIKEVS